jgi:bacterial/archaeal transporter family-2 protein
MPDPVPAGPAPRPAHLILAFLSGGLLTLMVLCNGTVAAHGTPLFASLAAHGTGALAATLILALVPGRRPAATGAAPLWAYLGGLSGAVTVMLTSVTVNSALALSGTLALGLAGQVGFGLVADRFGLFGLASRRLPPRDAGVLALIVAGSLLIIFGRGG